MEGFDRRTLPPDGRRDRSAALLGTMSFHRGCDEVVARLETGG